MRKNFVEISRRAIFLLRNVAAASWLTLVLSIVFITTQQNSIIATSQDSEQFAEAQQSQDFSESKQTQDSEDGSPSSDKKGKQSTREGDQTLSSGAKRGQADQPADPVELAKERKAREAAKKRGEITFDDLKFEMEKGTSFKPEMLTEENKNLNKKTWKIRGFILPTTLFSKSNIREFVLVRDNQECCFGPGAALYDCIMVTMAPGKSINFSTRVVAVKGVLEIDTESCFYTG
ncbi:MAG: DUF3299 domain-containing protein [Pirellula sp.]